MPLVWTRKGKTRKNEGCLGTDLLASFRTRAGPAYISDARGSAERVEAGSAKTMRALEILLGGVSSGCLHPPYLPTVSTIALITSSRRSTPVRPLEMGCSLEPPMFSSVSASHLALYPHRPGCGEALKPSVARAICRHSLISPLIGRLTRLSPAEKPIAFHRSVKCSMGSLSRT